MPTLQLRAWHAQLVADPDRRQTVSAAGSDVQPRLRVGGRAADANDLGRLLHDELPDAEGVTEEQLQQWLGFFESALRVVYRIPSGSPR